MMRKTTFVFLMALLIACGQNNSKMPLGKESHDSEVAVLKEAYVYGLPLILMDISRRQMTTAGAAALYAPLNRFCHNSFFPDASFKNVVRPNADTYYSSAWLDLSSEPLILSLPDTKGRYYMMPLMDAYSNVFASPGTRTTGNNAGNFLISGPQWTGVVPAGMQHIKSPTDIVWIIGRTQVNSKEDGAKNVAPLQQKYTLVPLSVWGKKYIAVDEHVTDSTVPKGDPNSIVKNMPAEAYFQYLNQLLAKNPPPLADKEIITRFATAGIGAGKTFDVSQFSNETRAMINDMPKEIFAMLDSAKNATHELINGWNIGHKVIGTYGIDYQSRAVIAYFGLGANLREDAIYPSCQYDADGKKLNGKNKYTIHFEKGNTPPANAFWSLTMYDDDGYFVENPVNRYALGDRSNLKSNPDGSVDIYIQKDNPGKDKQSNWLPASADGFNLLMRVYWPKEEMLNRSWKVPAVKRIQ